MKREATLNDTGVLGFTELWALGIGQVIGAMTNLPIIIFSSVTKYSGGDYSIITMLGREKVQCQLQGANQKCHKELTTFYVGCHSGAHGRLCRCCTD